MGQLDRPLVITSGDPAGIGSELTLKAWSRNRHILPTFCLIDETRRLRSLANQLKIDCPVKTISSIEEAHECFTEALPILPLELPFPENPVAGKPEPKNSPSIISSINSAVSLIKNGQASGMVTNPINKLSLKKAGFRHNGHTQYLGYLSGAENKAVMMLTTNMAQNPLRVVPVTVHLSLANAIKALDTRSIVEHGEIVYSSLKTDFSILNPRIAVSGLNPHAGEQGILGTEEEKIISPAISILSKRGINVKGPFPADSLFHSDARQKFDAVICMYHDQALIPIKTLDFYGGVNITIGLPFIRTSPDHGTAFDIAGKGIGREDSMIASIQAAARIAKNREKK
jgi:4-hydroxythreonine-4-phosphate dehydrogenase